MNTFNPLIKTTISRETILHIWNLVEDLGQVHEAHYQKLAEAGESTDDLLYWSIVAVEEWLKTLPVESPGAAIHRSLERKSTVYVFPEGGRHSSDFAVEESSPNKAKRVYRIIATSCDAFCIYVEAESSDEAFEIAEGVDGAYWKLYGPGDWDIDHAEIVVDTDAVEILSEEAHNTL